MTQRRSLIVDVRQEVAFLLIQDFDCTHSNDPVTVAHLNEETMEPINGTQVDLSTTDRRILGFSGLEITSLFAIDRCTGTVQAAQNPSPAEHVLINQRHLRDLRTSNLLREPRVPLTHTLNCTGILSQEGDNPQVDLTGVPHPTTRVWDMPHDLDRPGEGPIKQFPGYLQTFNLHHIPP